MWNSLNRLRSTGWVKSGGSSAYPLLCCVLGIAAYFVRGGLNYGIDFTGGRVVFIKFQQTPDLDLIRDALKSESASPPLIQRYDHPSKNQVVVRMQMTAANEQADVKESKQRVVAALRKVFDPGQVGSQQIDFNNSGLDALNKYLLETDPDNLRTQSKTTQEIEDYYAKLAQSLKDYRDEHKGRPGSVPG